MTTARIILPPELKESDRLEYEHLRKVKMYTRDEAVREIAMRRSRKIVSIISEAAHKKK